MSSNGFLQLNSCFAPRLSTSTLHEPATPASHHPRAPACTETLRLIWPRMPCQPSLHPLPAASKRTISRCNCRAQPPTATLQIIQTRSTPYKPHRLPRRAASFKSLYLKRPSRTLRSRLLVVMGASDTALRLIITSFDRHMEFVLDSFSVKADDSTYFTKDGHGGKEFDCAVPLSFRERSCSSRAQRFPAVLLRRPTNDPHRRFCTTSSVKRERITSALRAS